MFALESSSKALLQMCNFGSSIFSFCMENTAKQVGIRLAHHCNFETLMIALSKIINYWLLGMMIWYAACWWFKTCQSNVLCNAGYVVRPPPHPLYLLLNWLKRSVLLVISHQKLSEKVPHQIIIQHRRIPIQYNTHIVYYPLSCQLEFADDRVYFIMMIPYIHSLYHCHHNHHQYRRRHTRCQNEVGVVHSLTWL